MRTRSASKNSEKSKSHEKLSKPTKANKKTKIVKTSNKNFKSITKSHKTIPESDVFDLNEKISTNESSKRRPHMFFKSKSPTKSKIRNKVNENKNSFINQKKGANDPYALPKYQITKPVVPAYIKKILEKQDQQNREIKLLQKNRRKHLNGSLLEIGPVIYSSTPVNSISRSNPVLAPISPITVKPDEKPSDLLQNKDYTTHKENILIANPNIPNKTAISSTNALKTQRNPVSELSLNESSSSIKSKSSKKSLSPKQSEENYYIMLEKLNKQFKEYESFDLSIVQMKPSDESQPNF